MIHESYPWKEDLLKRKEEIIYYNSNAGSLNDEETGEDIAYTYIEKGIFYTAFIIRKLIDCKSKLSDEADKYALNVTVYNAKRTFDMYNRYPDEDSHDWDNPINKTVQGKEICNWLIHSFMFLLNYNEDAITVSSLFVTSDFDRNKCIYEVSLSDWLNYIDFIASDDICSLVMKYDAKKGEYNYTQKKRGS